MRTDIGVDQHALSGESLGTVAGDREAMVEVARNPIWLLAPPRRVASKWPASPARLAQTKEPRRSRPLS